MMNGVTSPQVQPRFIRRIDGGHGRAPFGDGRYLRSALVSYGGSGTTQSAMPSVETEPFRGARTPVRRDLMLVMTEAV